MAPSLSDIGTEGCLANLDASAATLVRSPHLRSPSRSHKNLFYETMSSNPKVQATVRRRGNAPLPAVSTRRVTAFPQIFESLQLSPARRSQATFCSKEPSCRRFAAASSKAANPAKVCARLDSRAALFGSAIRCDARIHLPCSRRKLFFFAVRWPLLHSKLMVHSNGHLRKTADSRCSPRPDVPYVLPKVPRSNCRKRARLWSSPTKD